MMKHLFTWKPGLIVTAFAFLTIASGSSGDRNRESKHLRFSVRTEVALQELSPDFCWFHPRAAAIPGFGKGGNPAVIMTIQKHLVVSDFYSGLYFMRTDDLGKTWAGPVEIPELAWRYEPDGTIVSVADVTPGWHERTGKLIAIGIKVRYSKEGRQLLDKPRSHDAAYAVFDPVTGKWSPWEMVVNVPYQDSKFYLVNPGCVQWLVKPDGTILLPVYFSGPEPGESSVTVFECSFDGSVLSYLKHGDEMTVEGGRGLGEPSLAFYKDTYYLTMRNDFKGYVTTSKDCMNWKPFKTWQFDDGQDLGSYNTQAHWLVHNDGLFLSYTRRGAGNDHIARNRAPVFLAEVDPMNLNVIRSTEQVLMPERGVMLGNFGASAITNKESWVTDAEFITGDKPHPRGADGTVWTARVIWSKKNKDDSGVSKGNKLSSPEIKSRIVTPGQPAFHNALYVKTRGISLLSDSQSSNDNGRTWGPYSIQPDFFSGLPYGYRRNPVTSVLDRNTGRIITIVNSLDTPGLDPKINEPPLAQHTYYLRYIVSDDIGKTWLYDEPIINEGSFTRQNPFDGIYIGKNSIYLGDLGCKPIVTRSGRILVPAQTTILGPDGELANPGGGFTYTDVLVLTGTWTEGKRLSWKASQRVQGDPGRSTRGMIEPTLLEMDDGRILMVMRGSNGGKSDPDNLLPSYKWYSVSKDEGDTWSKPEPWTFDDGSTFYSPSSMSVLFRHSGGRSFWVGNLSDENCRNNLPRFPLVMAEVDPESLMPVRSSLITIDTQRTEDKDKGRLDISHVTLIEDRMTREIILTYPRNTNAYKSTEWITVRLSLKSRKN